MEQTVNTFQKGMQLDTNPMLAGNDILTDALNATVVTMNGNELVLQNDMGNRKVNLAFLPDGYLPVGVKEYGGIIYVASYNPLTNKGLLGSFPSPRRYMGDYYQKDGVLSINETKINESKSGILLYPLTSSDFNIHTGDKFILYGNLPINDPDDKLSNYYNYNGSEIITPKNKLYTLSVGILNSLHEFVDITKSLIRWNGDDKLESTGSELKDFNNGYFVKTTLGLDNKTIKSLANQELNQIRDIARNVLKANTYSYKLTGPLYLKVLQNRVQSVNYTITGEQILDDDGKLKEVNLDIIGYLTYNCPDIFGSSAGETNSDLYSDLEEGTRISGETKTWFKLTDTIGTLKAKSYAGTDSSFTKYDETTDLYHAVVVNNVNIKKENLPEDNIWNYTLKIPTEVDGNNYIESLTVTGSIDLSLLNSGKVDITGFRFTNDFTNKRGTVTFNIQAYPKIGLKFTNLQFIIKTKRKEKITWDSEWNPTGGGWEAYDKIINIIPEFASGQYTVNFDWGLYLVDLQVFQAELKYTDSIKTDPVTIEGFWYITTELCNKCYSLSSDYYVSDYRDFIKEDKDKTDIVKEIVKEILTVNYDTTADVEDVSFYDEQNKVSGTLISKDPGDISIKNESIYHIRLLANCYGTIINPQLYPTELLDNIGNVSLTIHSVTDKINTPNSDTVQIETVKTGTKQFTNNLTELGSISKQLIDNNVNVINNTITFRDLYESTSIQKSITITNGFVPVKEGLAKLTEECKPGGIMLFTNQREHGNSNNHYFLFPNKPEYSHRTRLADYVVKNMQNESWTNRDEGSILEHDSNETFYLMKKENRDGEISTNFNYLSAEFFDLLNKLSNTTFAWCFPGTLNTSPLEDGTINTGGNIVEDENDDKIRLYDEGLAGNIINDIMARVWWKTNNNETWALLEFPFSTNYLFNTIGNSDYAKRDNWRTQTSYHYSRINNLYNNINSISDFLALFFPENLYFCLYKNYQGQYYMPYTNNEIYNKPYTLNYTCNIIHDKNITPTEGIDVNYYNTNNSTLSLLTFTQSEIPAGQISYETSVKSNEEFIDTILDSRSNSEFSNIALDTLQREDINGQSLIYNTLYEKNSDGKLVISLFNKAVVSDMGLYNTLLFNKSNAKKESLNWFRNEIIEGNDSTTKLEYSDLYIAHVI